MGAGEPGFPVPAPTYRIVRFYRDDKREIEVSRIVATGLTLREAREHCTDPKTRGVGWFDGYEQE